MTAWYALLLVLGACGRLGFDPLGDALGDTGMIAHDANTAQIPSGATIVFHFDENGGTTTTSADGMVKATLGNGVTWSAGVDHSAVHIPGSSFVDAPSYAPLVLTGALGISVWYELDSAPSAGICVPILIHGSAGTGGVNDNDIYALNLINPKVVLYSERLAQQVNATSLASLPAAYVVGVWHHLVVVRDAIGDVTFYFDGGAAMAAPPVGTVNGGTNGHLRIGGDVDSTGCPSFPGSIDELYIYPRELDANEAHALFEAM